MERYGREANTPRNRIAELFKSVRINNTFIECEKLFYELLFIPSLIKDDMENRLANLKLNENVNEDHLKEKQQEIEQECVSAKRLI